jgi:hypothetical protein
MKNIALLTLSILLHFACALSKAAEIDLRPQWDETLPLANPDKGWYHHYFDNTVEKYLVQNDAELTEFPGLDHVYLRLAWAYLEPAEGRFDWNVVDEPIAKWTSHGMGIAFRISCKETGVNRIEQQFATPRWVRNAGARGGFYAKRKPVGPEGPWEPVYDDPVFLAKLENFIAAFAARYDGKPWLRYVDIGSFGDWGEGHTSSGSGLKYGYTALDKHVDLHLKYFHKTQLIISDDFVFGLANPEERQRMHAKLLQHNVSYRDDSILVDWFVKAYSKTSTVRSPDLFADAWQKTPTVFELEHYGIVKSKGNWTPQPGSSLETFGAGRTGADYFRRALEQLHATYIGFHGYAREWLADNPALTAELLNRCGYWFFPHRVELPGAFSAGKSNIVTIHWQNRGVAPAYRPYDLILRLDGPSRFEQAIPSGNTRWLPGSAQNPYREVYHMALPAQLTAGDYEIKLKLHSRQAGRDVKLPLKDNLLGGDGFYTIGRVLLVTAETPPLR